MAQRIISGMAPTILGRILRKREPQPMDERPYPKRRVPFGTEPGPFDFGTILGDY